MIKKDIYKQYYNDFEDYSDEISRHYEFDNALEILKEQKIEEAIQLFEIPNFEIWNKSNDNEKLDIIKMLLKPIKTDIFPLERQFNTFLNLLHIKVSKINYHRLIECTFESKYTSKFAININPLIPKKYYDELIKKLYATFESFNIPIDETTAFLEELIEIWYLHSEKGYSSYKIAQTINRYDSLAYEPKQIERKISKINKLLELYNEPKTTLTREEMKELGIDSAFD